MPKVGEAGRARLTNLCGKNVLLDVLSEPTLLLRPEDEWPSADEMAKRKKKNWSSDNEWIKICCGCSAVGVFDFLRPDQLYFDFPHHQHHWNELC